MLECEREREREREREAVVNASVVKCVWKSNQT